MQAIAAVVFRPNLRNFGRDGNGSSIMPAEGGRNTFDSPTLLSRFRPLHGIVAATGRHSLAGSQVSGRQMEAGRSPAGSSRTSRLDPFALPVRFEAADEVADERTRIIELHRERVVLRRSLRGMRMAVNMPVTAFRGVAIRLVAETKDAPATIAVVLEHRDPALSLPLYASTDGDEIVAEWRAWGRVLGLPLLVAERDGTLREPFARLGALAIEPPTWRRRRRNALKYRRPSILLRRRLGRLPPTPHVHRGEREIIARN